MRATSQGSLDAAKDRWESVLGGAGEQAFEYGTQLFGVVDALDGSASLRRALTEPTRGGEEKATLITQLFTGKVDAVVLDLLAGMARSRWSADADIADATHTLALHSILASAQARTELERVEEEVFRIVRTLAENRDLRLALADPDLPLSNRLGLVDAVFAAKSTKETAALVARAVSASRGVSLVSALTEVSESAAERRRRLVAVVTAASPLDERQRTRLGEILARAYGREVEVHVAIDATVVGGMRIQIGDDVVDATMLSRLDEARRRLAG